MKEDNDILAQIGQKSGMTVPEGYFSDFGARMADLIEQTSQAQAAHQRPAPPSLWLRVRPYVYMAAMFAGVWCMLKMFTSLTQPADQLRPSPVLAEALGNEVFVNEYIIDNVDQWDLIDEMMEDGVDVHSLSDTMDDNETYNYNEI